MNLTYTTGSIAELENETKKPFTSLLADYSVNNLVLLVKKGLGHGTTTEEAQAQIDEYLKDGLLEDLYLDILSKLEAGHFLPSQMNVEEMRVALKGSTR